MTKVLKVRQGKNWKLKEKQTFKIVNPLIPFSLNPPHPFCVFDEVTPTGTLGNPFWKDAILDRLFRPLDNICKLGIFREMVEVPTVGT